MSKIFGIDVSKWQKGFDFGKAADEGVSFAVIKGSQAEFVDPEFSSHYTKARNAGILTGVYHYLTATSEQAATAHAKYLIDNCLKGRTFEYPIFADAEDPVLKALDKNTVDKIITAFCTTLENAGYWAGFYCNYDFYKNHCNGESLSKRFSFWLASWTKEPLAECQMWQFGGETNVIRTNKVAGVICDQNYSYVDYPSLIKAKGLNGYVKSLTSEAENGMSEAEVFNVGDIVQLSKNATVFGTDKRFASWVCKSKLYIREIKGNRAVISTQKTGAVTGAVDVKFLESTI